MSPAADSNKDDEEKKAAEEAAEKERNSVMLIAAKAKLEGKKAAVEIEQHLTPMQQLVHSTRFTIVTTAVICVNGIIIGIETDHGDGSAAWQVIEVAFLICYLVELALRLIADGMEPLKNDNWVRFDALVCLIAVIDMAILGPALEGSGGEAKQVVMVIRIVRLMKLARVVRLLKFFKELWLLVSSFGSAFKTLGWTFCLLTMVLYVFSIMFVKMLGQENDDELIQEWFGSMGAAMFSLFQVGVTMDSWSEFVREVWATDQWFMAIVLVIFMGICSFAIMNTVLAVICEHTIGEAMDQGEELLKIKEQELHQKAVELAEIFKQADTDKGGTLSKDEFVTALDSAKVRHMLQEMDLGEDFGTLDRDEIGMLFDVIDVDNNHELSPKEFVNGLLQMRGEARARGIFELHCAVLKGRNQTKKMLADISGGLGLVSHSPLVSNGTDPHASSPRPHSPSQEVGMTKEIKSHIAGLEARLDKGMEEQTEAVTKLDAKMQRGIEDVSKSLSMIQQALGGS